MSDGSLPACCLSVRLKLAHSKAQSTHFPATKLNLVLAVLLMAI